MLIYWLLELSKLFIILLLFLRVKFLFVIYFFCNLDLFLFLLNLCFNIFCLILYLFFYILIATLSDTFLSKGRFHIRGNLSFFNGSAPLILFLFNIFYFRLVFSLKMRFTAFIESTPFLFMPTLLHYIYFLFFLFFNLYFQIWLSFSIFSILLINFFFFHSHFCLGWKAEILFMNRSFVFIIWFCITPLIKVIIIFVHDIFK